MPTEKTQQQKFIDECKGFTVKIDGEDKTLVSILEKHCHTAGCELNKSDCCRCGKGKSCTLGAIGRETMLLKNPFYAQLKKATDDKIIEDALALEQFILGEEDGIR